MKTQAISSPNWSTASFGETADTSPMELAALGAHLNLCRGERGSLFTLRCAADSISGFMNARIVTTIAVTAVFAGICSMVL